MKRPTTLAIAGLLAATVLGPRPLHADTVVVNPPVNPTTTVSTTAETTEPNTPVIASGAVTFGLAYGAALVAAGTSDVGSPDRRMFVPVIGPWLDLADRPSCPVGEASCDPTTTKKILIGADGAFQAIGLLVAVYGIMTPIHRSPGSVEVVPVAMGTGGNGIALAGSF